MAAQPQIWPRPYIISIHQKAIAEGCCRVEGLAEPQARSLIASFYRIRKRGDTLHKKGFIPDEFHMVMAQWEPGRGSVLFTYDALPDGNSLPELVSVPAQERIALPERKPRPSPGPFSPDEALDIDNVVEQLAAAATKPQSKE